MSGACAAIALDGAGDERIVHRALGSRRFRIHFRGAGGHSWTAFGVPNAVHAAALAARMLARTAAARRNPRTTLSVGRIGGGISVNAIPDDAWLEIDLRSTSERRAAHLRGRDPRGRARRAARGESARRARRTAAHGVDHGDRRSTERRDRLVAPARERGDRGDAPHRSRAGSRDGEHGRERADQSRDSRRSRSALAAAAARRTRWPSGSRTARDTRGSCARWRS